MSDYPVGICDDRDCVYAEPHRHGFACDTSCACAGVGAETAPLQTDSPECDWGACDRPSVAERRTRAPLFVREWLPVCSWHAGWDDYEYPHATACRRCRHDHVDHRPMCSAWQATIPGLPDAEPCACGGFQ
jgi:hypothetical protein